MTLDEARAAIGRKVVYVSEVGQPNSGVITSIDEDRQLVLVRYEGGTYPSIPEKLISMGDDRETS